MRSSTTDGLPVTEGVSVSCTILRESPYPHPAGTMNLGYILLVMTRDTDWIAADRRNHELGGRGDGGSTEVDNWREGGYMSNGCFENVPQTM